MPTPTIYTSDTRFSCDRRSECEGHDFGPAVRLPHECAKLDGHADAHLLRRTLERCQNAQPLRQLYESQCERHERIGAFVIARWLVAHDRISPHMAASAQ